MYIIIELVSSMLQLDPNNRPTLAQVMSNPWLAPHLYRLATTLGALPCTSKVTRPLSRPNSFKRAESFRLRCKSFIRYPFSSFRYPLKEICIYLCKIRYFALKFQFLQFNLLSMKFRFKNINIHF